MINLKEVITKYPECLESASKLRSYLIDLYPNEKRDVFILCTILDCGIADEIKGLCGEVDDIALNRFCSILENSYGIAPQIAKVGLLMWKDLYYFLDKTRGLNIVNYVLKGVGLCKDKNIIIPNIVTEIDVGAFENSDIESIEISHNVKVIREKSFYNCEKLKTVKICGTPNINREAFTDCCSVKTIYYEQDLKHWLENPAIIESDDKLLYIGGQLVTDIKIKRESFITEKIKSYAFYGFSSIKKITILDGVNSIGEKSFFNCRNLEEVVLSGDVAQIGIQAFSECPKLKTVYFGDNKSEWVLYDEDLYAEYSFDKKYLYKGKLPESYSNPSIAAGYLTSKYSECFWQRKLRVKTNNDSGAFVKPHNEQAAKGDKKVKYKLCPKCNTNYIREDEDYCDVCKGKYKTIEPKYDYIPDNIMEEWEQEERESRKMDLGYLEDIDDCEAWRPGYEDDFGEAYNDNDLSDDDY